MDQNTYLGGSFFNLKYFNPDYLFPHLVDFFRGFLDSLFGSGSGTVMVILSIFAIFFIAIVAYCAVRLLEIRAKENRHLKHEITEYAEHQAEREKKLWGGDTEPRNLRWVQILQSLFSPNAGDWKLAVIEADSMLETLMGELGFKGDTLGDKLKSADRDTFHGLTSAWEVHNIRNQIAHAGSAFELSQHEAKRVIALYEQIFREFGYI